jgi:hypothetical protein
VGSSDAPIAIDQFNLGAKIVHGTGAGQLSYGAMTVEPLTKTATTWSFRMVRTFTNGSGGVVTVREIGLVLAVPSRVLLARDLVVPARDIPAGGTLTVRYIPTQTV